MIRTRPRLASACLWIGVASAWSGTAFAEPASGPAPGEPVCTVKSAQVVATRTGVDLALERAGKALVATDGQFNLAYLSLPDCRLEPILSGGGKWPSRPVSITPAGDVLYDDGTFSSKGLILKRAGAEPQPLLPPPDLGKAVWNPMLSDDGSSLVWLGAAAADGESDKRLHVRDLASGTERSIPLDSSATGYVLLAANVASDEYVVGADPNRILVVDGSGAAKQPAIVFSALEHGSDAFRRIPGGWIAGDSVRLDNSAVRLQWSTAAGSGQHEFPQASIASVSATPDGKRVAVSAPAANREAGRGAVVVLALPEGNVIFQHELSPFSRPSLTFLDEKHLAVTTDSRVEVLHIP